MNKALIAGASQGVTAGMRIAVLGAVIALVIRLITSTIADYVNLVQFVYWATAPLILLLLYLSTRQTSRKYPELYAASNLRMAVLVTGGLVALILVTALYVAYAAVVRLAPNFPMEETQFLYQEILGRIGGAPFILTAVIVIVGCIALAMSNLITDNP